MQDLCIRILLDHLSGSCRTTYTRSLYQDPCGPLVSGSCSSTCARTLSQDPIQDPVRPFVQDLSSRIPLASESCKRANYARRPRKLKIRTSKTSVFCETSSKTEDPDLQNERFLRDFHENGNMFQKYCACHEIMTRGHTKGCTGHAK